MTIETPTDACAALAVLIVGADELGTTEESQFLFETMAALPIFAGLDHVQFATLMADTTEWVWSSFPTEGNRVTEVGASELLGLICGALPPEMRMDAFRAAAGLAQSDGMSSEEELLLERLRDGLEIDPRLAREFLEPRA